MPGKFQGLVLGVACSLAKLAACTGESGQPSPAEHKDDAAMPIEPAPSTPAPLASIAPDDARALVVETLGLAELQRYLHPEAPGRIPLRLVAEGVPAEALAGVELFGAPIEVTTLAAARASNGPFLELSLRSRGPDSAAVSVRYAVEGIVGDVKFSRTGRTWLPGPVSIREQ